MGDILKAVVKCDKCECHQHANRAHVDPRVVGKTLAFTSIEFTNSKGQLAARGSHTK